MRVRGRTARPLLAAVIVTTLIGPSVSATTPPAGPPGGIGTPRALSMTVNSDRGVGHIDPGEACAEGGDGGYWHYDYEAPMPAGVITGPQNPLPGSARLHLDLHSEEHIVRAQPGEAQPGDAWLQGTDSAVTLGNQRGTVTMQLRSVPGATGASCTTAHGVTFDGIKATAPGLQWQITERTGSYREATGSGTADVTAEVAPGADNPFSMTVNGNIAVLQPSLKLEPIETYWAFLGAHYLIRRVTVVYRVTNQGAGDAFNVKLTGATSPTAGVKLIGPIPFDTSTTSPGPVPQHLADIPAGQSEIVRLRWDLPFPAGDPPCELVILGCEFDTTLTFDMPDALDVVQAPQSQTVHVKAPNFPPPVVD